MTDAKARLDSKPISFADLPPLGDPGAIKADVATGVLGIDQVELANGVTPELLQSKTGVKLIGRIDNEPYFDANVIAYYADKFRENLLKL